MINIRKAKSFDVKKIVEISNTVLQELEGEGKLDFFGGVDEEEVQSSLNKPSVILIAEEQSEILGFMLLNEINEHCYELNGYAVLPKIRRCGVAKKLAEEAKKYLKDVKAEYLRGTVHPSNEASICIINKIATISWMSKVFSHKMKDGRELLRQQFVCKL